MLRVIRPELEEQNPLSEVETLVVPTEASVWC